MAVSAATAQGPAVLIALRNFCPDLVNRTPKRVLLSPMFW